MALNMEKVVEIMERTMRLQLKLTPRSAIFAIRTRVLTFFMSVSTTAYPRVFGYALPSPEHFASQHSPRASPIPALHEMSGLEGLVGLACQVLLERS